MFRGWVAFVFTCASIAVGAITRTAPPPPKPAVTYDTRPYTLVDVLGTPERVETPTPTSYPPTPAWRETPEVEPAAWRDEDPPSNCPQCDEHQWDQQLHWRWTHHGRTTR